MFGLPPSRPRDGANGLRSLADLADINDMVYSGLLRSLTTIEVTTTQSLMTWNQILDDVEWTPTTAPIISMRGTFGLLAVECRIPRGTPAFTAYLDRGWGIAHAAANNTTGVAPR